MTATPRLYIFTISHFSEKARWACERKGIRFRLITLLPGLHPLTVKRFSTATHVPLLVDGNDVIQDSSGIIDHLDRRYPDAPLTPAEPAARAEALRWEAELNSELGETSQRLFYFHALQEPRFLSRQYALGAPFWGRWFYALALSRIVPRVRALYGVDEAGAARDLQRLRALIERLDRQLSERRYLAGDTFSRADLTLAALSAGLFRPPEHPLQQYARETLPSWAETIAPFRDTVTARRVLELYRTERHRRPTSAPARAGGSPLAQS